MKILVINCGSSSVKYQLMNMEDESVMAKGNYERIGMEGSFLTHKVNGEKYKYEKEAKTHEEAIRFIMQQLTDAEHGVIASLDEINAILDGLLKEKQGIINAPIARKPNSIIERCISPDGDKAITHYKVLKKFKDYSLVEFLLETGRTHQIRVHSKYIGHPIVGDTLYGKASAFIQRQALHAYKIKFAHPISNKPSIYIANIEEDIKKLIY